MLRAFEIAKWLTYACVAVWLVSALLMNRLPSSDSVDKSLFQEPIQKSTRKSPFTFTYNGQTNKVTPVANYEMWGMVVSHNDPSLWYRFDLTHDNLSPDTRDFCIIWGNNLKSDDFKKVSYSNDDYTCNFSWSGPVKFNQSQLSNNHLITGDDEIRKKIARISIGDQIRIKGKLVNYSESRWNGRYRNTSMSRKDEGNGACEIIYVQDIEIIRSQNGIWSALNRWSLYGFLLLVALRSLAFWLMPRKYFRQFQSF